MAISNFFNRSALSCGLLCFLLTSPILARSTGLGVDQSCRHISIPMSESLHGAAFSVTVGTPPQIITMLSDWTWHTTWVDTPHCEGHASTADCIPTGQNFFNDGASSTYRNTTDAPQSYNGTDYTPGIPFSMIFGTDVVCLSGLDGKKICDQKSVFEASSFAHELPFVADIGGIFGFAPVLPGFNETYFPTPYQFMLKNLLEPVIGWHMCGGLKSSQTCDGQDFLTIMGGTARKLYEASRKVFHHIVVSPCVNSGQHLSLTPSRENYWSASWTGLWINTKPFPLQDPSASGPCDAIDPIAVFDQDAFGHGAPMPPVAFSHLVKATHARQISNDSSSINGGSQGLFSVPCHNISGLPHITYELSHQQNITVAPAQYIDTKTSPGKCLLNARVWDRPVDGAQTFFGLTVLSRTYVEFDMKRNLVGLAPLKRFLYE